VVELLAANGKTTAHRELSLKRLREIRRLTQQELARRLDVKQATVSKLEQREDEVLVSTLKRVVAALGGKLEIVARFADGPLALELGDIDAEPLPPQRPPSRAK
jgi:transcriptional regulator with XRE-family HTH domain